MRHSGKTMRERLRHLDRETERPREAEREKKK